MKEIKYIDAGTAQQVFEWRGAKLDEKFFFGGGGGMLGNFYLISLKRRKMLL